MFGFVFWIWFSKNITFYLSLWYGISTILLISQHLCVDYSFAIQFRLQNIPYSSNHKISSSVSQQKWTNSQCLFFYFYFKHFSPQPTTTLTTYFPQKQKQKQKPLNQLGQPTRGGVQEPNQDPDHPSKGGTAETTCAAWPLFSFDVPRVIFSPDQNITSLSCLNSPLFSS